MSKPDVIIVGAGTIGLSIGWKLVNASLNVVILEAGRAGRGTSWKAAGMLAPAAELSFEELDLYGLNRESSRRWPEFAAALESASGMSIDYRREGTLVVADDRDSAEALRRLYEFQVEHDVPVEWLAVRDALEMEPFLHPRLAAAVYAPDDHQVDNRLLVDALQQAFERQGGILREQTKVVHCEPDEAVPRVTTAQGERMEAGCVVLAMGPWAQSVEGLERAAPPVRPVKGQTVEVRAELPFDLQHVVRGPDAYLAPKSSGRLLVGATSEERGFDTDVTAGGLYRLLEGAWEVVPGIEELVVTDMWAGLRPSSRDHKPLLGPARSPGVIYAMGHYRHGILLTPVTADEISRLIIDGTMADWMEPFHPNRFFTEPEVSE
jgi:glycine oxidase